MRQQKIYRHSQPFSVKADPQPISPSDRPLPSQDSGLKSNSPDPTIATGMATPQENTPLAPFVDLAQYHQPGYEAGGAKVTMLIWWLVQAIVFPLTLHATHGIRRALLRLFGAKIGAHVVIRPTARFTYPWNIEIGDYSWIGDDVVLYSLAPISIGEHCVISQKSYLCTGSHDISDPRFGLKTDPITLEPGVWVATDCFVGPGVHIGANAVIGARSSVFQSMPAGQICFGTPCKPIKPRPMDPDCRPSR